jgi:aconitate hydratase
VVGKFVEFFGPGLDRLPLADRATIANMAPEYGATVGFFPVDNVTLDYLRLSGPRRTPHQAGGGLLPRPGHVARRLHARPGLHRHAGAQPRHGGAVHGRAEAPQDRIALSGIAAAFQKDLASGALGVPGEEANKRVPVEGADYSLGHGDTVIAAITSCTNTSNPFVLVAAGLVARKARALGLTTKPWVKTSLAPGSQVVTDYLDARASRRISTRSASTRWAMAAPPASAIPGPLPEPMVNAIEDNKLVASAVLSGQPQLRGAGACQYARQLPGLAAAGRGLRAGRHGGAGL